MPVGDVVIGAIRVAENEAELAAVLGHEVTHVGSRHMFNTLKKMSQEEMEKSMPTDFSIIKMKMKD